MPRKPKTKVPAIKPGELQQDSSGQQAPSRFSNSPPSEIGPDDVPDLTPDPPCQMSRGAVRQNSAEETDSGRDSDE